MVLEVIYNLTFFLLWYNELIQRTFRLNKQLVKKIMYYICNDIKEILKTIQQQ